MPNSNTSHSPMFSIITATLNAEDNLEQCIGSLRAQIFSDFEHIIIDGGSVDRTKDIIEKHSESIAFWTSEQDSGISDAMNKGIDAAKGRWLLFLHADDFLTSPHALETAYTCLSDIKEDIIGLPIAFGKPDDFILVKPKKSISFVNFKMGLPHQGCFTRREVFLKIGKFDTQFKISMDYELILRAIRHNLKIRTIDVDPISFMRDDGISSRDDWASLKDRFLEEKAIHKRHADTATLKILYFLYWPLYLNYRRARHSIKTLRSRFTFIH